MVVELGASRLQLLDNVVLVAGHVLTDSGARVILPDFLEMLLVIGQVPQSLQFLENFASLELDIGLRGLASVK